MWPLLFDMGLPMIFPSVFLMVVALLPIILLEAFIIARSLRLGTTQVIWATAVANLATTVVGIPIWWLLLTIVEFGISGLATGAGYNIWNNFFSVTLGAPWVAPRSGGHDGWIILGAMLFLLIPYFFASWGLEYLVVRAKLVEKTLGDENTSIFRTIGKANLASYLLLAAVWIVISYFTLSF